MSLLLWFRSKEPYFAALGQKRRDIVLAVLIKRIKEIALTFLAPYKASVLVILPTKLPSRYQHHKGSEYTSKDIQKNGLEHRVYSFYAT